MEVRSFDVDLSEIMASKFAKLLPRAYQRLEAAGVVSIDIADPMMKANELN